jgi:IclR family transcriptional regulator, acetate operon repressor
LKDSALIEEVSMSSPTGTQAVDRALGLLTHVMESATALTFSELQESSGLAKSTLSRLLSSLEAAALISRTPQGLVRPGPGLIRFAYAHAPNDELLEFAQPAMQALNDATGETINLAVLLGHEVEQISQIDCTFHMGGVNWGVSRVPLHCSALGKAFLAYGAQLPEGRLTRLTPRSVTNRSELEKQLVTIRERGWAMADSELEIGLIAIAAPIFRESGDMIGAMSISGPTMRMTREVTEQYAQLLLEETSGVSEKFGYTGTASNARQETQKSKPTSGTTDSPGSVESQVRRRVGAA